jgi:hypothetical protein
LLWEKGSNILGSEIVDKFTNWNRTELEEFFGDNVVGMRSSVKNEFVELTKIYKYELKATKAAAVEYKKRFAEIESLNSTQYIDPLCLSAKQIEELVSETTFKNIGTRDDFVEKYVVLPNSATHFYSMIFRNKRVPHIHEFCESYITTYYDYICNIIPESKMDALRGRVSRAFESILRDFHFYHFLKESGQFKKVNFNLMLDIRGKVDVSVLSFKGIRYGIQLRLDTPSSNYWFEIKKNRGFVETGHILLDTPLRFNDSKKVKTLGNAWSVYDNRHLTGILEAIKTKECSKQLTAI